MLLLLVVLGLNPTLPPTSSPSSTCAVNALPNSSNSDAGTEIPQGQATTWQCHTGFKTDNLEHEGTYEAYCLGDGAALSAGGGCTEILCAVNGLTNAAAPQSVSFNAAATWTCNIGHQNTSGIGGGAYRSGQCGEDGDSLIAALGETCTAFTCPIVELPDASTDGVAGAQLGYGATVTWQCDDHFETSVVPAVYRGSYTATCDAPGSVTAAGTCIQVDCAVNLLGNASRAPGASINHSDTATWTCNSGFETSIGRTHQGFYTADCGDGGDALTADGSCNQITCAVQNLNRAAESSVQVNFGDTASWQCNLHFKNGVSGVHRGSFTSGTCGAAGDGLTSPAHCIRIQCAVDALDYATNSAGGAVNHGDDVTWICAQGYKNGNGNNAIHQGSFTATCGDSGNTMTASDSCVPITCDAPPDDPHATEAANAVVVHRDQPTYTCDLGYVLSTRVLGGFSTDTENIITCNLNAARNDGEYTPRATSCTLGCVDGQYTNTDGGCLTCTAECNFGGTEYETRTCAAMNDRRCASCTIGSYRETLNNGFADACVTCSTTCAPGQRITGDCRRLSLTSDPLFCTSCTPGTFYASQTTANDRTDRCVDCGVGHVCPYSSGDQTATTKTPCNASDEFMAREDGTVCADVLEGYYTVSLDGVHNTDVPHGNQVICERGRRCPTSAGDRGKRFDCAVDQGQFQSGEGATACDTVSRGWYTTPINEALRTGQAQCERGYRCNPDTGVRTKCELNTFTSELGQTECQSLTDSFYVVVKDTSPDRLRIAEVEATEGQYVSTTTVDQDGDRHLIPCGRGYQCPYRGDRDACADNITFSEILSGPACLPCYRCPTSEIITAECIPAQDTVCNDEVPPVFELATDRITLEAVSDPVYDAFGESDPVTAYDDRSTFEDPGARQLLTDRIRRSSNSTFISPPPQSCSYLTERCSFVSPVDMTLVGTHTITYTVRDNSDNSQTASRVVTVVDTTPPVITLNTDATVFIQVQEDPYAALLDSLFIGLATASDTLDDLLGNTLVPAVPDDQRDRLLEAIGVASDGATLWDAARLPAAERLRSDGWRLNYTDVVDSNGNSAAAVTQTFILRDGSPPEIVANNRSYAWNAVRNSNQPFEGFPVDYGATALDFVYGDLSNTVTVQSDGGFTLAALGDYTITYHVADPSGNGATATAVVSVVDTLRPVMTLRTRPCLDAWCDVACSSASECDVNYGSVWSDPGVDVADTFAPQNQLNVNVRGALDQTTVGAGSGFVFTPPAATTPATAVPLNTSAPLGTRFVLSYNVVDSAQNAAVTRTRTVTIVDVPPRPFSQRPTSAGDGDSDGSSDGGGSGGDSDSGSGSSGDAASEGGSGSMAIVIIVVVVVVVVVVLTLGTGVAVRRQRQKHVKQPSAQIGGGPKVLQFRNRNAVEAALLSTGRGAGTFCVRVGRTGTEVLSLVTSPSAVAHYDVRRLTDASTRPPSTTLHLGFASGIGPGFPSLAALLDHYERHPVNNTGDPVVLSRSLVKQSGGSSREPEYATVDYSQMMSTAAYETPVTHNPVFGLAPDNAADNTVVMPQEQAYAGLDGRQTMYSTAAARMDMFTSTMTSTNDRALAPDNAVDDTVMMPQEHAYAGLDGRQTTYSTAAARPPRTGYELPTLSTYEQPVSSNPLYTQSLRVYDEIHENSVIDRQSSTA